VADVREPVGVVDGRRQIEFFFFLGHSALLWVLLQR
jgi:hypothetical protein